MGEESIADKYQVPAGNVEAEFVDADGLVLVNKKSITDLESLQIAEEEALALAYGTLLAELRLDTPLTCDLLRYIHQCIFGDLFDWAGRWRTVQISKPGAIWPPPQYLNEAMRSFERDVLVRHPADSLSRDEAFCSGVGEIQGEFLAIHPFREGNARTIKLATNLLAAQTGRPFLVYDDSEAGQRQYVSAARAALLQKD